MRPLDDIERDASEATPGPWIPVGNEKDGCVVDGPPHDFDGFFRELDTRFIAAARTDVPEMAAEIRRLRALIDRIRAVLAEEP